MHRLYIPVIILHLSIVTKKHSIATITQLRSLGLLYFLLSLMLYTYLNNLYIRAFDYLRNITSKHLTSEGLIKEIPWIVWRDFQFPNTVLEMHYSSCSVHGSITVDSNGQWDIDTSVICSAGLILYQWLGKVFANDRRRCFIEYFAQPWIKT